MSTILKKKISVETFVFVLLFLLIYRYAEVILLSSQHGAVSKLRFGLTTESAGAGAGSTTIKIQNASPNADTMVAAKTDDGEQHQQESAAAKKNNNNNDKEESSKVAVVPRTIDDNKEGHHDTSTNLWKSGMVGVKSDPKKSKKDEFVFVTACSENHMYVWQVDLMQSLELYVFNNPAMNNFEFRVIFYDLDSDDEKRRKKQRMIAEKFPYVEYRKFDFSKYPDYFDLSKTRAGEYAWKPVIIKDVIGEQRFRAAVRKRENSGAAGNFRSFVYWLDAGLRIQERCEQGGEMFANDIEIALQRGIASPGSHGTLKIWTYQETANYLNLSQAIFDTALIPAGCIILTDVNNDTIWKDVIEPFAQCARVRKCIAPPGSSKKDHRQDQSALGVLMAKAGIEVTKWDCIRRGGTTRR